jgi:hypothetical protein
MNILPGLDRPPLRGTSQLWTPAENAGIRPKKSLKGPEVAVFQCPAAQGAQYGKWAGNARCEPTTAWFWETSFFSG